MDTITFQVKDELGFCTRTSDGVSGMTVTALANFCGVEQPAITQMLNKIRDFDPITNDLPKSLKPYAGIDWRLITNDAQNSLYVIDELCHAILEYYAIDTRKYKGKSVATNNYRTIARAGLRVFIWSQTGYSPQTLSNEQMALLQAIPAMQSALAQLQSQLQNLLPVSADFIPPGWNEEVWQKLPPQDKRHFRYLFRRRRFRPSNQGNDEPLLLPQVTTDLRFNELKNGEPFLDNSTSPVIHRGGGTAPKRALCKGSPFLRGENCEQLKQKQQAELQQLQGEVSQEEKQRLEAAKQEALRKLWAEGEQ